MVITQKVKLVWLGSCIEHGGSIPDLVDEGAGIWRVICNDCACSGESSRNRLGHADEDHDGEIRRIFLGSGSHVLR